MTQHNMVLNSRLQGVLSCLDVQLEAELIRYRRQKAKARSQASKGKDNPLAALDLSAFTPAPLRQPARSSFSWKAADSVQHLPQHPEMDSSILSTPLPNTPQETPEPAPPKRFAASSEHPFADFEEIADVARIALDRYSALLEQSQIEADMAAFAESSAADLTAPRVQDYRSEGGEPEYDKSEGHTDENYVILSPVYTPQPVNWSDTVSSEDEPTVLECFDASEETLTVDLPTPLESITSIELPPELSEAELLSLGAPLAIVESGEMPWSGHEDPNYEVSDEDNLWPDELDEEPWGLVTPLTANLQEEVPDLPDLVERDDTALEHSSPDSTAIEASPHWEEPRTDATPEVPLPASSENAMPLGLPSADRPRPSSRLVPVGHHVPQALKPLGQPPKAALNPLTEGGYLASSEALLDSLDEEEGSQNWTTKLSNLFTPQGIGSALLLIFSALAVSMVLLNPELVNHWKLGRFAGSAPEAVEEVIPDEAVKANPPALDEPNTHDPNAQEFLNLDLGNLSKVKPKSPVPSQTLSTPTVPGDNLEGSASSTVSNEGEMFSNLRDSLAETGTGDSYTRETYSTEAPVEIVPNPQPVKPARSAAAPAPAPIATAAPQKTSAPPRQQPTILEPETRLEPPTANAYVVVTPYTSDRLLDESQAIVPNAYLKNTDQGANIQFGVFNDPDAAAAFAEQLQQEGIPVEVVPAD